MNKQIKKSLALVLCLVMMVASVPLGGVDFGAAFEVAAASEVASGECGDSVTWVLDEDYVLTISGSGEMDDYVDNSDAPWCEYRTSIKSVVIESGVTSIGESAIYACTNLTSVEIAASVKSISKEAFYCCTSLTSITIPGSVESIGYAAFSDCTSLESVTIENGVQSIDDYAFNNCTNLTSITIPGSVENIGNKVFRKCSNLETVYYYGTQEEWDAIEIGNDNTYLTDATIEFVVDPCADGHTYEVVVTTPTCIDQGYTTYTCFCGESYIGDYVVATGVCVDEDGDDICDVCDADLSTDTGSSSDSSVLNSLNAFWQKIVDFFNSIAAYFQDIFNIS